MTRLLLVEDEPAIRGPLVDLLEGQGYAVDAAATGEAGLACGLEGTHEAALLDVMLPGIDGFTVCERLRAAHPRLGILILTARGSEEDVLAGFRAGADDYVPKPFSLALLLARIQAILRRVGAIAGESFQAGSLRIDPARLRAEAQGVGADLTRRDIELLARLVRDPGAVVSRSDLLADVWGYAKPDAVETRCVDMHLVKLRRKLAAAFGSTGDGLVETVRGEGYRILGDD